MSIVVGYKTVIIAATDKSIHYVLDIFLSAFYILSPLNLTRIV